MPRADSSASASAGAGAVGNVNNREDGLFTLLTLDGEFNQVNGFLAAPKPYFDNNISVLKLSAACSKRQQPNDCMKSFNIVKKHFRSRKSKITDETTMLYPDYVVLVKRHLAIAGIDRNSIETFIRFVGQLESVLSTAYTIHNVQDGWQICGLGGPEGYSCRRIMSQWSGWGNLNEEEQDSVLEKINKIASNILENSESPYHGEVFDSVMEAELKDLLGRPNLTQRQTDSEVDANGICVSLWRSLALTKDFKEMIDSRRAARETRRRAVASSGDSNTILQQCHTCSASFTRVKWQRVLVSQWRVCKKCKKHKYFCPSTACFKAFELHPQHTLEPSDENHQTDVEVCDDQCDLQSCQSELTEDLFWLYGGHEIPKDTQTESSEDEEDGRDWDSLCTSDDDIISTSEFEDIYESESEDNDD